ncbi:hypothetical protein [Pedobacter agri]|uniref:hypothetical protein n=1 Tax=Pedobacter agri TaxID=454586 RepID=UPI0027841B82|nr:hypothetical protein [Pedobacter agri]MDQ1139415.1 division protein CdvB (Snf7/Vps24/ESCRT-III family) [Pedobacter agri]
MDLIVFLLGQLQLELEHFSLVTETILSDGKVNVDLIPMLKLQALLMALAQLLKTVSPEMAIIIPQYRIHSQELATFH